MPDDISYHTDRTRADSFGGAAHDYDRYRPRYPDELIAGLVRADHVSVLDVGAGTGIASQQLRDAGAEVLAVEPDPRMAQLARDKGLTVELATFEDWDPAGRSFDLVVFASSFHWVEPRRALPKVAAILRPGGVLALMWNRITPVSPTQSALDEVYSEFLETTDLRAVDPNREAAVSAMIEQGGFTVARSTAVQRHHYDTNHWINMACTYSNILTLPDRTRAQLRMRLAQHIGTGGVDAENDAIALLCTPHRPPGDANPCGRGATLLQ
ncbi:class I SAM-dependent methyltransferase [Mycolicibacterium goodii]|uniref:Methyltransferase type 11 domain-containing protein n=1 Tax=Mycolicibacterium goodii TaxID=134601 RepID=A0A0K0X449_MYCGD|nr:hypothetical protein AFA91_10610 [Mycolicibacterium goodii]